MYEYQQPLLTPPQAGRDRGRNDPLLDRLPEAACEWRKRAPLAQSDSVETIGRPAIVHQRLRVNFRAAPRLAFVRHSPEATWCRSSRMMRAPSCPVLAGHLGNLTTSDPGLGMTKSKLIKRIASQNPHLYQPDIENIVNSIIDEIIIALGR